MVLTYLTTGRHFRTQIFASFVNFGQNSNYMFERKLFKENPTNYTFTKKMILFIEWSKPVNIKQNRG